jgi:hypothetical protein
VCVNVCVCKCVCVCVCVRALMCAGVHEQGSKLLTGCVPVWVQALYSKVGWYCVGRGCVSVCPQGGDCQYVRWVGIVWIVGFVRKAARPRDFRGDVSAAYYCFGITKTVAYKYLCSTCSFYVHGSQLILQLAFSITLQATGFVKVEVYSVCTVSAEREWVPVSVQTRENR